MGEKRNQFPCVNKLIIIHLLFLFPVIAGQFLKILLVQLIIRCELDTVR